MGTILIATDGSPASQNAVDTGLGLAAASDDSVVLVSVWDIPVGQFGYPYGALLSSEILLEEQRRAQSVLDEAAARAGEAGVPAETVVREGRAVDQICNVAAERGARMIVMGAHGWGPLAAAVHGSVSLGVLHQCDVPVLIVKERKAAGAEAASPTALPGA